MMRGVSRPDSGAIAVETRLVPVAQLVQLRRDVGDVLEGVDDDVVYVAAPHDDVAPVPQRLVLVGRPQPPRLQDILDRQQEYLSCSDQACSWHICSTGDPVIVEMPVGSNVSDGYSVQWLAGCIHYVLTACAQVYITPCLSPVSVGTRGRVRVRMIVRLRVRVTSRIWYRVRVQGVRS